MRLSPFGVSAFFSLCFFSAAEAQSYKPTNTVAVPFGAEIAIPYILDEADIDGDGTEDFALSAMVSVRNKSSTAKAGFVHSFIALNDPISSKLELYDLGDDGLTQRTWAGKFVGNPKTGMFFVLGRNGEIGLPHTLRGEQTAIFRFAIADGVLAVETAFLSSKHSTTASVAACGAEAVDVYINTVNSPFISNQEFLKPEAFIIADPVLQGWPQSLVQGMDNTGAHNGIVFRDIDGDGDCDFLAAFEPWKVGDANTAYLNKNVFDRFHSYVLLNDQGKLGGRIDLPSPPF
jgi:hypothetical protein